MNLGPATNVHVTNAVVKWMFLNFTVAVSSFLKLQHSSIHNSLVSAYFFEVTQNLFLWDKFKILILIFYGPVFWDLLDVVIHAVFQITGILSSNLRAQN